MDKLIPVTKPYIPNLKEYLARVKRAFDNEWLTNRGELVLELEAQVRNYLDSEVKPLVMNNGTIPIQIALKLFGNKGQVITTPFSYIATTSSIIWEGCTPIFVDIDEAHLTVDENKIEEAITDKTTCILATHVFGNPCETGIIEQIAQKHNLKVIYDAAHCFGVKYKKKSVFDFGDISTCSFHATKLFHTGEGGAAFINRKEFYDVFYQMHNFGHNGPFEFSLAGINGKMSEINAAMGLAVLNDFEIILKKRKEICEFYDEQLIFEKLKRLKIRKDTEWNFSYYPVIFQNEQHLIAVLDELNKINIFPRRYFYPSLNTIKYLNLNTQSPISESISERILCLPIYHTLCIESQLRIIKTINKIIYS
jgi:dTDP-4-amino-4,6-dideoxygalactose transaminase